MANKHAGANQPSSENNSGDEANSVANESNAEEQNQADDKSSIAGSDTQQEQSKNNAEEPKFTQKDLNNFLAKEKRKWEKDKNLTPEQLLQKELDDLKAEKAESAHADEFKSHAGKSGALDLDVVFSVMRRSMDFDEKGKLTNYDTVIKLAKAKYPSLFKQGSGSQDGGAGAEKTSAFSMNNWLRGKN